MQNVPESVHDSVGGISWEARPEWLLGRYWWRVYVNGNPRVFVRYLENAEQCGAALAADEARFRREARGSELG